MRIDGKLLTKSLASNFFVKSNLRPWKAYHLPFSDKLLSWTYARDVQNSIIKAYQSHHHTGINRRPLPPTIITFRFEPVFTYGRSEVRPSSEDRRRLETYTPMEGVSTDTRMAWDREYGWRYHGPGQVQCWMVADLDGWRVMFTHK
jgi:lipoate-protein ligase B